MHVVHAGGGAGYRKGAQHAAHRSLVQGGGWHGALQGSSGAGCQERARTLERECVQAMQGGIGLQRPGAGAKGQGQRAQETVTCRRHGQCAYGGGGVQRAGGRDWAGAT
ncbi:hypothetical protein GGX14DRAFT_397056 [Mycena pura]|uniref:Uncharacterized protein n=1 Tax=Mycena pura TaxID=153505 RepID=A0AAD6VCR0_9AGAR|nr:hypothetical protein GGX14DRAFT_397056 [Mycena pura]